MIYVILELLKHIDIPAWIQALTSIVAMFLSVITFAQTKKIKELAEIVNALSNQTQELSKHTELLGQQSNILIDRYKVELASTITERIPYFIKGNIIATTNFKVRITIKNVGISSDFYGIKCQDIEILETFEWYNYKTKIEHEIVVDYWLKKGYEAAIFSFNVYYYDRLHQFYTQTVDVNPAKMDFFISSAKNINAFPENLIESQKGNPFYFAL